jgi:hypothetical protein
LQSTVNPQVGRSSVNCREWFDYHEDDTRRKLIVCKKQNYPPRERERENRILQSERETEITFVRKRNRDN